jgi:RNase P subunit RPR2
MNQTSNNNPLSKYFRQPAIYLRLPSGGKFYEANQLDLPPNSEIPIFPMTAVDEITNRTPDALFNGSSTVGIIGSCAPNILDPWGVSAVDLSALLCAIRIASYGHDMEMNSTCPKCGHVHEINVDLRIVLDSIQMPDYTTPLVVGDLSFYFVPLTYRQINDISRVQYEDSKLIQTLNGTEMSEEERLNQLGDAFRRITNLTIRSISASIGAVKTQDAMVTDGPQIEEFLLNAPKTLFEAVRDKVIELRTQTDLKPVSMTCEECNHQYQQEFTLDMSNFFGIAS